MTVNHAENNDSLCNYDFEFVLLKMSKSYGYIRMFLTFQQTESSNVNYIIPFLNSKKRSYQTVTDWISLFCNLLGISWQNHFHHLKSFFLFFAHRPTKNIVLHIWNLTSCSFKMPKNGRTGRFQIDRFENRTHHLPWLPVLNFGGIHDNVLRIHQVDFLPDFQDFWNSKSINW